MQSSSDSDHIDRSLRSASSQSGSDCHSASERHVCSRYRHSDPALSALEDRFPASSGHGRQLYLCYCFKHCCSKLWVPCCDRRCYDRWSYIIFLVSAAETIGDTSALVSFGLDREITGKKISGSLACDGYASTISSLFGCPPVTSFSQNVGLVAMTKVVNRFTIMTGAVCMILAGLLPPIGNFFASLPDSVVGGCTIMMFGSILTSGVQMIASCGFSQRNITIVSLSLAVGIGFTTASESGIWDIFPSIIQSVFAENVVAVVFVISIVLSCILPENMDIEKKIKE